MTSKQEFLSLRIYLKFEIDKTFRNYKLNLDILIVLFWCRKCKQLWVVIRHIGTLQITDSV